MAPKRPHPLEEPPAASSSEEEEEEEEEDEEEAKEKQTPSKQVESEEEESDDEEEESDDEELEKKNNAPIQVSSEKKNPQPESSSEIEDGAGSEYESDSDLSQKFPRVSAFTIKPVPKSVVESETPISKIAATGKSSGTASSSAVKRPPPNSVENGKASKAKKVKPSTGEEADGSVAEKKSAFSRLWSEEDEIAILKGIIHFQSKKGYDPASKPGEFHEFMKNSLHVDVSKNQLMDKVRRLKRKYKTNMEKSTNDEDPVLSKPHDCKSFQLSKKVWGTLSDKNDVAVGVTSANNVNNSNHAKASGSKSARKSSSDKITPAVSVDTSTKEEDLVKREAEKEVESNHGKEDFAKRYPFLMNSFNTNHMSNTPLPDFGLNLVRSNLNLVGKQELKELDSKWKKLNIAETEVYLRRIDLIREQTRMILDAMKSSKS